MTGRVLARLPRTLRCFHLVALARSRAITTECCPRRRTAYEILGVAAGAGDEEIKAAYRRQAFRCHPDMVAANARPSHGQDHGTAEDVLRAAEEEFKAVESAYSELLGRRDVSEDLVAEARSDTNKSSAPPYLQVAMIFSVPVGMIIHDVFFGSVAVMREEQALLAAGGWACPVCTLVNKAGTSTCPCGAQYSARHTPHAADASAELICLASFKHGSTDAQRALQGAVSPAI